MASDFANQLAEQVWGKEPAQYKTIDPELTKAFAEILDEVLSKPWLGNATTEELLDELKARVEIHGCLHYRTVDD